MLTLFVFGSVELNLLSVITMQCFRWLLLPGLNIALPGNAPVTYLKTKDEPTALPGRDPEHEKNDF